jgi:hypothetical protein
MGGYTFESSCAFDVWNEFLLVFPPMGYVAVVKFYRTENRIF